MIEYEFEVPEEGDNVSPFPCGTNIKTACHGLLLVALEQTENDEERNVLNQALVSLDVLDEDSLSVSFRHSWPWATMTHEGLVGLAVILNDLSDIGWDEIEAEAHAELDTQIALLTKYLEDNSNDDTYTGDIG